MTDEYKRARTFSRVDEPEPWAERLEAPATEPGGVKDGSTIFERWIDQFRPWYVEDVYPALGTLDDNDYETGAAVLKSGSHRVLTGTAALGRRLSATDSRWTTRNPWFVGTRGLGANADGSQPVEWIDPRSHPDVPTRFLRSYTPIDRRWAPRDAGDLRCKQLSGRGSRTQANAFLDGEDGLVDPSQGTVQGWKACFGAYGPNESLLAIAIVGRPRARVLDQQGDVIELYRLAAHPIAPSNTNSWLIGRVRNWATNEGYDQLISYANLDVQEGTCYEAAGFELDDVTIADHDGWQYQGDDRSKTNRSDWQRGRYTVTL